jgi:membrane protease YdiL (CAAX protease family)
LEPVLRAPDESRLPAGAVAAPGLDRRSVTVLLTAVVLLIVFEYWGLPGSFSGTAFHRWVADRLGAGYGAYFELLPYQYWGVSSLLLRVAIPFGVVALVLREPLRDWGWRIKPRWRDVRPYVLFLMAMIPLLALASLMGSFQAKYPFYDGAIAGGWHFWGFQLFYGLQFLGVEAFFRGFLLFGLERRLGWYAIGVMVIPYVMIHFGKPAPETFAAIVAGVLLGWMALRTRSFLWGAALHWAVAITMDVTVLSREIGLVETLGRVF